MSPAHWRKEKGRSWHSDLTPVRQGRPRQVRDRGKNNNRRHSTDSDWYPDISLARSSLPRSDSQPRDMWSENAYHHRYWCTPIISFQQRRKDRRTVLREFSENLLLLRTYNWTRSFTASFWASGRKERRNSILPHYSGYSCAVFATSGRESWTILCHWVSSLRNVLREFTRQTSTLVYRTVQYLQYWFNLGVLLSQCSLSFISQKTPFPFRYSFLMLQSHHLHIYSARWRIHSWVMCLCTWQPSSSAEEGHMPFLIYLSHLGILHYGFRSSMEWTWTMWSHSALNCLAAHVLQERGHIVEPNETKGQPRPLFTLKAFPSSMPAG